MGLCISNCCRKIDESSPTEESFPYHEIQGSTIVQLPQSPRFLSICYDPKRGKHKSGSQVLPIAGLPNLRNNCYINVICISLTATPGFSRLVKHATKSQLQFPTSFSSIFAHPEKCISDLLWKMPTFNDGHPHCAHNFLYALFALFSTAPKVKVQDHDVEDQELISAFARAKGEALFNAFGVVTQHKFTCTGCDGSFTSGSMSWSLSLPILTKAEITEKIVIYEDGFSLLEKDAQTAHYLSSAEFPEFLQKCTLKNVSPTLMGCYQYTKRVTLMTSANKLHCARCGNFTQHFKQTRIIFQGENVIFHLQRYRTDTGEKDDTYVKVPSEIDLGKRYDLYAVINHKGKVTSGHYWVFARSGTIWYRYFDEVRTEVRWETVGSRYAYLLFYHARE